MMQIRRKTVITANTKLALMAILPISCICEKTEKATNCFWEESIVFDLLLGSNCSWDIMHYCWDKHTIKCICLERLTFPSGECCGSRIISFEMCLYLHFYFYTHLSGVVEAWCAFSASHASVNHCNRWTNKSDLV